MQPSDESGCDIMLVGRQVARAISARHPKETPRRLVLPGICKPKSTSSDPGANASKGPPDKVPDKPGAASAEALRPPHRHRDAVAAARDAGALGRLPGGASTHTAAFRLAVLSLGPSSGRPKSDSDAARMEWPPPAAAQTKAACLRREHPGRIRPGPALAASAAAGAAAASGLALGARGLTIAGEPAIQSHRQGVARARAAAPAPAFV